MFGYAQRRIVSARDIGIRQFGVITEATLKIRRYTPLRMHYFYYDTLRTAIEDMQLLEPERRQRLFGHPDDHGLRVNLLVAFDSAEREAEFRANWQPRLRGYSEFGFALCMMRRYTLRPWKLPEAWYLLQRKRDLFPSFAAQSTCATV